MGGEDTREGREPGGFIGPTDRLGLGKALDVAFRVLTARATYLAFGAALLGLVSLGSLVLRGTEGVDFWEHVAAMRAFSEQPLHPPNPYLLSPAPTHLFTPYHWFWGLVARVLGVHPLLLVPLVAAANLALFLVGADAVARRIVGDRRWSLLVALSLLLLWWNPWDWSGIHDLGLLPLTASYPYWFALGLSLLVMAWYPRPGAGWALASVVAVAVVFLVHPITALLLLVSCALRALLWAEASPWRRAAYAALPALGVGAAFLWPFFPVLQAIAEQGRFEATGFSGSYRTFYRGAGVVLLPAIPGAIHVVRGVRRKELDLASWGTLVFLAIYLINLWTLRSGPLARSVAFVALFLQLGVVMLVSSAAAETRWVRRAVVGVVLIMLAVAGVGEAWDSLRWVRIEPWTSGRTALEQYGRYRPYDPFLDRDDVVLSDPVTSWMVAPIAGTNVVAVLHPNPFFHEHLRRLGVIERFLGSDREGMLTLIERYGVTHILLPQNALDLLQPIRDDIRAVHQDGSFVLLRYVP